MNNDQEKLLSRLEDPAIPLEDRLDDEALRVLLRLSSSTLDWVTLERIENLVAQANRGTWIRAMLGELPQLAGTAPAWAVSLLGDAIENDLPLLRECLESMPEECRRAVQIVIAHEDFSAFYGDAGALLK